MTGPFGKDERDLQAVAPFGGSFSQRMRASARRPKRTGGKFFVNFNDQFQPNEHRKDKGRLIAGAYQVPIVGLDGQATTTEQAFWQFKDHYFAALETGTICSAGPFVGTKNKADPCHGCDMFWEDWNIRKQKGRDAKTPNRVSLRDKWVWNWLNYGLFHKLDRVDKTTGQLVVNQSTGEPYYDWVLDTGPKCEARALAKESKQGHMQPWPLGYRYFKILQTQSEYIGGHCTSCGTSDSIVLRAWACAQCGKVHLDPFKTQLNDKEIEEMTSSLYKCGGCGNIGFLSELVECASCDKPRRATLFDVDMLVTREKSEDEQGTQLVVLKVFDPAPIADEFKETAKPLALDRMYAPDSLEVQARKFKIRAAQPEQPTQPSDQAVPPRQPVPEQGPTFRRFGS
jgi:hypothetical protein